MPLPDSEGEVVTLPVGDGDGRSTAEDEVEGSLEAEKILPLVEIGSVHLRFAFGARNVMHPVGGRRHLSGMSWATAWVTVSSALFVLHLSFVIHINLPPNYTYVRGRRKF
jgi:hypothetical protein